MDLDSTPMQLTESLISSPAPDAPSQADRESVSGDAGHTYMDDFVWSIEMSSIYDDSMMTDQGAFPSTSGFTDEPSWLLEQSSTCLLDETGDAADLLQALITRVSFLPINDVRSTAQALAATALLDESVMFDSANEDSRPAVHNKQPEGDSAYASDNATVTDIECLSPEANDDDGDDDDYDDDSDSSGYATDKDIDEHSFRDSILSDGSFCSAQDKVSAVRDLTFLASGVSRMQLLRFLPRPLRDRVLATRITFVDQYQGLDWDDLASYSRLKHAASRASCRSQRCAILDAHYRVTRDAPRSTATRAQMVQEICSFKHMRAQSSSSSLSASHPRLRDLVAAPSRDNIFFTTTAAVQRYDAVRNKMYDVFDLTSAQSCLLNMLRVSALASTRSIVAIGTMHGECFIRCLPLRDSEETDTSKLSPFRITKNSLGVINHMSMSKTRSGCQLMSVASNDAYLTNLDLQHGLYLQNESLMPFNINCTAASPDRRLELAVGDSCETLILDAESKTIQFRLEGHTDHAFACAWSSQGDDNEYGYAGGAASHLFATGSEDLTARLYDARQLKAPLAVLAAGHGPIRGIKFDGTGRFLAMSEPADFVHVYDMLYSGTQWPSLAPTNARWPRSNIAVKQTIDFFGEVSGIDFYQDRLFIGVVDDLVGGIMEWKVGHAELSQLDNVLFHRQIDRMHRGVFP